MEDVESLIEMMTDNGWESLEDALIYLFEDRQDPAKAFLDLLHRCNRVNLLNDPSEGAAIPVLLVEDMDGHHRQQLHITQLEEDPRVQAVRIIREFEQIGMKIHSETQFLYGISWLITPRLQQLLNNKGFTPETGTEFIYFDLNELIDNLIRGEVYDEGAHLELLRAVFRSAFRSLVYSEQLLKEFLLNGRVPDIGMVRIPTGAYYSVFGSPKEDAL